MSILQKRLLSDLALGHDGPVIPAATRIYFQERMRSRVFEFLVKAFLSEQTKGLTKAKLARRIAARPEVVNRWLAAPSNLTVDSISDLLLGIKASEPQFTYASVLNRSPTNHVHLAEFQDTLDSGRVMTGGENIPPPRPTTEKVNVLALG